MTPAPPTTRPRPPRNIRRHRRQLGKSWVMVIAALAVLAGVGVSTYFVVTHNRDNPAPPKGAGDAEDEIVELQEEFKRYYENQLDMVDLLPAVRSYTKRFPDRVAGHILLAQVLMKMELYSEAYPALDRALEDNADNFDLRKLTGTCAAKLGLWPEAERHLLAADAMRDDEDIVLQLANLFFQTGRLDEAFRRYQDARSMSGTSPPHKSSAGLAEVHAARGEYEQAFPLIQFAIQCANSDTEAEAWVYQLSEVRMRFDAGEWEKGEQQLDLIQGRNPEVLYLLPCARLRARLQAHHGRPDLAVGEIEVLTYEAFTSEHQTDREKADILAEHAYWLFEAGNTAAAREQLAAVRSLAPEHPRLAALEARAGGE